MGKYVFIFSATLDRPHLAERVIMQRRAVNMAAPPGLIGS